MDLACPKVTVGASPWEPGHTTRCPGMLAFFGKIITIPVEARPAKALSVSPDAIAFGVLSKEAILAKRRLALHIEGDLARHCDSDTVFCPEYLRVESNEPTMPSGHRLVLAIQDDFARTDVGGAIAIALRHRPSDGLFGVEVDVSGFLLNGAGNQRGQ